MEVQSWEEILPVVVLRVVRMVPDLVWEKKVLRSGHTGPLGQVGRARLLCQGPGRRKTKILFWYSNIVLFVLLSSFPHCSVPSLLLPQDCKDTKKVLRHKLLSQIWGKPISEKVSKIFVGNSVSQTKLFIYILCPTNDRCLVMAQTILMTVSTIWERKWRKACPYYFWQLSSILLFWKYL